jgi:ABC transporter
MENLLSAVPQNRGDSLRGAIAGKRYWRRDEAAAIARAQVILRRFGLEGVANSWAGDLSGGQRRLVEIMRALMTEPSMLLLDEPMAGVHPNLARRIGNELVELVSELALLHPRNDTFPGEVFLHVAADALDWCRASRADPLPLEGLGASGSCPSAPSGAAKTTNSSTPCWPQQPSTAGPNRTCLMRSPGG